MKKNILQILAALIFVVLGLPKVEAQRIDALAPTGEFLETLYLTYALYFDETFEVYLDEQGIVSARSECDNAADLQHFINEKSKEFKTFATLSKEDFGDQAALWCERLPEEIYAALVKAENMRAGKQNNLCANSSPFCTDNGLYEFPAGVNAGTGEPGPYYSCLGTRPNPAWYYMRILDPGDMDIYMYSSPRVDIDFCCWGPFDDPIAPCPDGLTRNKVVDCSYSTDWEETCKIRNAQTGDYFILLITNYSNRACDIHFSKVAGNATTDCSILPPLVSYNGPACEGVDLQLFANGTTGDSFHWFFLNGNWSSNEQNPVRPNATHDMSGTYGCIITRDGQQSDTTYLDVIVHESLYYQLVVDTCNSFTFLGVEYTESGHYEEHLTTATGCDSVIDLTLTLSYTPNFEIAGDHWPIGGSETYISVNEYAITLDNPLTHIDTVLWQVDCENWYLVPHGHGETCTLYIHSFLEEPVMLHAAACNICDTIRRDFSLKTTYFGVDENTDNEWFAVVPNPNTGDFTIDFGALQGQVEVTIYDVQGRLVACKSGLASDKFHWNLEGMPSGLYLIKAVTDGKSCVRRVLIR